LILKQGFYILGHVTNLDFVKALDPQVKFASWYLICNIAVMDILIHKFVYQIMLAYVQDALPLEACGLLAGRDNLITHIYIIDNVLRSPVEFEMDAQQQIEAMLHVEAQGLELIAAFHSHPMGPQTPSQKDVARAYYPEMAQIIVSLAKQSYPSGRAFSIIDKKISELQIVVIDR